MKKHIDLALKVKEVTLEGQNVVSITVPPSCLRDVCLCLQLLQDSYVDAFTTRNPEDGQSLELYRGEISTVQSGRKHRQHAVSLNPQALSYVLAFFIRYYRDGYATVDHIDIEDEKRVGDYITFRVKEYTPPLSAEEARRRLGIP